MIKVLCVVLAAIALSLGGCAFVPDVIYNEASDGTNGAVEENAGSIATGTMSIRGTFSSSSDGDLYKVDVGTRTSFEYDTLYNGDSQRNLVGISFFPMNYTTYDASGTALMPHLLMAGGSSDALEVGTSYIIFSFWGNSTYPSGSYELQLR